MTRPLRLEFPGALYHVTARGNRRQPIYRDDADRRAWLDTLGLVCRRHRFVVHSFCQMTNHFHLLVETQDANLALGMRGLNGAYSQYVNRRHGLAGHLFQGRYKAILVQKESYLLELARYIVLNPVRAKAVASPDAWPWSSYHFLALSHCPPPWHGCDDLLSRFGDTRAAAVGAYRAFVLAGIGRDSPLAATRHRVLLGDDAFVARHQELERASALKETARAELEAVALPLAAYRSRHGDRNEGMARAYHAGVFTMPQIAAAFGVSTRTVSRAVAAFEGSHPLTHS